MKAHIPVYCLMVKGIVLDDENRTMLYRESVAMYRKRKDKLKLRNQEFEAQITTNFSHGCIGPIWGVLFHATIENHHGITDVSYVVRDWDLDVPIDLDHGKWVTVSDADLPNLEAAASATIH